MSFAVLLIILIALLSLLIGPSFGAVVGRPFWIVLFIAVVVALILVLVPMAGVK